MNMMTMTPKETGPLSEDDGDVGHVADTAKADESETAIADLEELKDVVREFLETTQEARALSERCRDYKDGKQWTDAQIKELKRRKQAPIVNNRIKVKHQGLLGLMSLRKADPKAYPRNQSDADNGAAEAATDGLRYVAERGRFTAASVKAADNFFCEGYCGVHICGEMNRRGEIDIVIDPIDWDRIFFDPYSTKPDFSDARDKGFMVWMDERDILAKFPDAAESGALDGLDIDTDTTFEDKPTWHRKAGRYTRHLVATHYFQRGDDWYLAIYTGSGFLMKPQPSPYTDEFGSTECPLEFQHAYIDRNGNRYGELASFLDLQDEINHRRSKALFLNSQRQTFGNRGSINDIKKAKRELAKPDGHLEVGQGEFGKDFGILPTGDMAQAQFELLQEAKSEIDAQSYNAQNAGARQQGDISGVAIKRLTDNGIIELNTLFDGLSDLQVRVHRQCWNRIRQYWDEEKWVRVTDDHKDLKFIGFNVPVTMKEYLQDIMDDDSKPAAMRLGASAQMIMYEQSQPDALEQVIMVQNKPAELDMDIILDQTFDSVNASQEQLDAIIEFGAASQFDIIDLLEISNITGKDKLIERLEKRRAEAAEAAQNGPPDPQAEYLSAKAREADANVEVKKQDATQTAIENERLQQTPVVPFKGTVSA